MSRNYQRRLQKRCKQRECLYTKKVWRAKARNLYLESIQFFPEGVTDAIFRAYIQGCVWRDRNPKPTAPGRGRQGFEKLFFPGIEVGLPGWQRSHSQGSATGFESFNAIRYAPEEVNQEFQRLGIERYLRELVQLRPADTELWLTTVTTTHPRTLRLKEIQYRVDAVKQGLSRRLFEASIEVADQSLHSRVTVNATQFVKPF
jgi:hypothetical protein